MTTQEQKALELALDALKSITWVNSFNEGDYLTCNFKSVETSITAIKEVLAQQSNEQVEPAFWYSAQEDEFMTHKIRKEHERLNSYTHKVGKFDLPLYTHPPVPTAQSKEPTPEWMTEEEQTAYTFGWFKALEQQRLAQPKDQETLAYRAAARLAECLFKKHFSQEEHYASGRVVWGLCDSTAGVISQIDNMVCQLVKPKEPEQKPEWEGACRVNGKQIKEHAQQQRSNIPESPM